MKSYTKSDIFKLAHLWTKNTIKQGDSYSATFALCLKHILSEFKKVVGLIAPCFANGEPYSSVHWATWTDENGKKKGAYCMCLSSTKPNLSINVTRELGAKYQFNEGGNHRSPYTRIASIAFYSLIK